MIDVTERVGFQEPDSECLPLTRCVCGAEFRPWQQCVSIYVENAWECPKCKRRLLFSNVVRVFEHTA